MGKVAAPRTVGTDPLFTFRPFENRALNRLPFSKQSHTRRDRTVLEKQNEPTVFSNPLPTESLKGSDADLWVWQTVSRGGARNPGGKSGRLERKQGENDLFLVKRKTHESRANQEAAVRSKPLLMFASFPGFNVNMTNCGRRFHCKYQISAAGQIGQRYRRARVTAESDGVINFFSFFFFILSNIQMARI